MSILFLWFEFVILFSSVLGVIVLLFSGSEWVVWWSFCFFVLIWFCFVGSWVFCFLLFSGIFVFILVFIAFTLVWIWNFGVFLLIYGGISDTVCCYFCF